ncbi:hypothetical protein ACNQ2O_03055, partial [Mycoplasma sp. AA7A]
EDGGFSYGEGINGAFYGSGISEFIAPNITNIGESAFAKLNDVTKVSLTVPSRVKIAANAFDSQDKYQIVEQ